MVTLTRAEVVAPLEAFRLQARLVPVPAGLHIVRYVSAKDSAAPPVILIQAMPEDAAFVTLLSSKEGGSDSLVSPGDAIVVRAQRDVRIVTTTASLGSFGAESAVIKIERIDQVKAPLKNSMAAIASVDVVGGHTGGENGAPPESPMAEGENLSVALQKELVRRDAPVLSNY